MKKHQDTLFLLFLSLLGTLLVLYATAPFGTGISGDSIFYLSGADNIVAGNGYTNHFGNPLTLFPPFLSYFMALLMKLFNISSLSAGNIINALSFGATIYLSGVILRKVFNGRRGWYYFGAVAILLSRPLFSITTTIASDTLFNVFVLIFFYYFYLYSQTKEIKYLLIIAVFSSFSVLIRYLGVLFILSGIVMVFITEYPDWKKALKNNILFGSIASLGTLYFVIIRNFLGFGTFTGIWTGEKNFFGNLEFSFNRIMNWFIPYSVSNFVPAYLIILSILTILGILINKNGWKKSLRQLNDRYVIFILISSIIYYCSVLLATFTNDHIHYADDRYYLPLYFPLLLMGLFFFDRILSERINRIGKIILAILVTIFFAYHVEGIQSHIEKVRVGNDRIYNAFNLPEIRDQEIYEKVNKLPDDYPIVTNYTNILYLFSNRTASPSLFGQVHPSIEELEEILIDPPWAEPVYLVWFETLSMERKFFTPEQLSQYFDMEILNLSTFERLPMTENLKNETGRDSQIFIIYP